MEPSHPVRGLQLGLLGCLLDSPVKLSRYWNQKEAPEGESGPPGGRLLVPAEQIKQ